jgi:RNA polymerase sigma factor (sigma-70 family)
MHSIVDRPQNEKPKPGASFSMQNRSGIENESLLWSSLRSGNKHAFEFIIEKYIRSLYAYGSRISNDAALIENAIQDVFVDLWKRHEILSDIDNIQVYLLKTLRRTLARLYLLNYNFPALAKDENTPPQALEFSSLFPSFKDRGYSYGQNDFRAALTQLTSTQREVLYLKFCEYLSYEQVGDVMNLSEELPFELVEKASTSLRKHIFALQYQKFEI